MMPADDLAYVIPTESVVDCIVCDKPNRTDIYDDIRSGDWAYLFQCVYCDHINDEHGNSLDRGAVSGYAAVLMFVAALGVIGAWGHYWPLFWAALWVFLGLLFIALFIGANNNDQPEEGNDE